MSTDMYQVTLLKLCLKVIIPQSCTRNNSSKNLRINSAISLTVFALNIVGIFAKKDIIKAV